MKNVGNFFESSRHFLFFNRYMCEEAEKDEAYDRDFSNSTNKTQKMIKQEIYSK